MTVKFNERHSRNQEKAETQKGSNGELGKMTQSKDVSSETEAKISFLITVFGCQSWTVRKADGREMFPLEYDVGGDLYEHPRAPERQTSGS